MGLSTSKSTTKTNRTENVTQTPTYTDPAIPAGVSNLLGRVDQYGTRPAADQVAPTSQLQQRAFDMAGGLGGGVRSTGLPGQDPQPGYGDAYGQAGQLALSAANAPANTAGFAGYVGPQTTAATWNAPTIQGNQIGNAVGANVPSIGDVASWQASLIAPGSIPMGGAGQAGAVTLDPAAQAARVDASGMIGNFQNPYVRQVYDASMADFDANAGRTRAAQAAAMAARGAFGGSRSAIEAAQTEGELARGRAATGSNILATGYDRAVQAALAQAGLDTNVNVANMQGVNDRNLAQGRISADINLGNADNQTRYSLGAGDIAARIAMANQEASNLASRDTALSTNDFRGREFDQRSAAERERAAAANDFTRTQFTTDADRLRQQAELEARSRSEGTLAENQTRDANANRLARSSEFTAGALTDHQRFNAGQEDTALARRLEGARTVGDLANAYAGNFRADTALTAQLGGEQRQIDQQQRLAELAQLQAMAQLYPELAGLLRGQSTSGTMSGTEVTKERPGLFQAMLALGQQAARAVTAGAGG